jgi:pyrroline-5-carboxylate reductase
MSKPSITFIGGGNMAQSILAGLLNKGFSQEQFMLVDPDKNKLVQITHDFGIKTYASANSEILNTDYLVLAVKPQIMREVCNGLSELWTGSQACIISIAAGIRIKSIEKWLARKNGNAFTVVRSMPNTPALLGLAASGLVSNRDLDAQFISEIETIFSSIGISVWLDNEAQIDTVTALSGSGPAYFFQVMNDLIAAGIAEGLTQTQAQKLVLQTALGSAHMAMADLDQTDPERLPQLIKQVTSKGGTTEAGLKSLHATNLQKSILKAVQAAKSRAIELSEQFGD